MSAFLAALLLTVSASQDGSAVVGLIPSPKYIDVRGGDIRSFRLEGADGFHPAVLPPTSFCREDADLRIQVRLWETLSADEQAIFPAESSRLSADTEAYAILLRGHEGWIVASARHGLQHGLATLRQTCILAMDADEGVPEMTVVDWPDTPIRGGHVCYHLIREWMPYSAPGFDELIRTLERFARLKLNTVLLELEAMFPYRQHREIASVCAFTPEQIREIAETCRALNIELIPMVQCLGHQYYLLSHERYAEFRETPDKIQQICPTHPTSAKLILELIDEYLTLLPDLHSFHLGGDEARQLGDCVRCREKVEREGISALYADHVAKVCDGVIQRGLTPSIWSDMFEHHPECLERIPQATVIAYWNYYFSTWPREYALPHFLQAGYRTIAYPGIRFGKNVSHASVNYPVALAGITDLTQAAIRDGADGVIATNWMKGIPFDLCWRGYAYAAWEPWTSGCSREAFDRAFAALWYGLDVEAAEPVAGIYEALAVPVPYAEDSGLRLLDRLQRYDLSGLSIPERIAQHTSPENREDTLAKLLHAETNVSGAMADMETLHPRIKRHEREWRLLDLGARTLVHKIRMGRVYDRVEAWKRGDVKLDAESRSSLRGKIDSLKTEWAVLREETRARLAETHHPLSAASLAAMKFEMAAFRALEADQRLLMEAERSAQPERFAK